MAPKARPHRIAAPAPSTVCLTLRTRTPQLDALPEGALKDSWRRGMYYLLPSFWRLFRRVAALRHEGRDVRIVFRTFGADLPDVCAPPPSAVPASPLAPPFRRS